LFHLDLYRLADATDVLAGGLVDDRRPRASRSSIPDRMREVAGSPARRADRRTGTSRARSRLPAIPYRRYVEAAA
jgi:hypothetical protein